MNYALQNTFECSKVVFQFLPANILTAFQWNTCEKRTTQPSELISLILLAYWLYHLSTFPFHTANTQIRQPCGQHRERTAQSHPL